MSTTNEAFIKAYRADTAGLAAPRPAHLHQAATTACRTSVEIVSPDYAPSAAAIGLRPTRGPMPADNGLSPAPHFDRSTARRSTGKQPLSTFIAERAAPPHSAAAVFVPETTVSAFHWPRVCRALWDQYRDQYERVAEILLAQRASQRSLIGVAGVRPGDGCTTSLLCLAMGLAAREASVILVDANFAAPRLAHRLGVEPTTTWQDVLARGVPVAEAVIRAAEDHVDLLPLGGHTYHADGLAGGLQPAVTAGVLRHAYQIALLDLGPIFDEEAIATTGQLIRNMRIDAAILVTDAHRTDAGELAAAGDMLRENGCELLGAIENRIANTQAAGHAQSESIT